MTNAIEVLATGAVLTIPAAIAGIVLVGGTDAATVALSDGTAGTDTVKIRATAAANETIPVLFSGSVKFETAVYCTLSGTSAKVYVYYN